MLVSALVLLCTNTVDSTDDSLRKGIEMQQMGKGLCFDDILLIPQYSNVLSRHNVDIKMNVGNIHLNLPVIAAPMDTVCDTDMCIAISKQGGMGILHRYMPIEDLVRKTSYLVNNGVNFGVSIGATNGYMSDAYSLIDAGAELILVDTANGHSTYAVNAVKSLRKEFGHSIHIMAGNIATYDGYRRLEDAGADSVRVGIGGGAACTTRIVSGHGVPTLQSIIDIYEKTKHTKRKTAIIADGGIRNSGDMVKAFAAGADAVMVGSMFAGTDESPGEIITNINNEKVKVFRGMASAAAQKDAAGKVSVSEGISTTVPYKGSVLSIINDIRGGLGSGCSYSGAENLAELAEIAEFVVVSSASLHESKPHAL